MGDVPHPNAFHIPRYSSTATAAGEQRNQHALQRQNNHHQLLSQEIPIPYFYVPCTFSSDPQSDYLSVSFHGTCRSAVPFSDSETEAELELEASSEEELEEPKDVDFLVDEKDDQVSFITNLFERPAEDSNLCLGLDLGLGQLDEDMDDCDGTNCAGLGVAIERNNFTSEVDLELGLGVGLASENGRGPSVAAEPKPCAFVSVSGQESSPLGGLRVVDLDSESDSDQNGVFDTEIRVHLDEIDDHPPFCWDYLGFNQQQQNDANQHFEWQEEEEEEEEEVLDRDWEIEASSIVIDPLIDAEAEGDDVLFEWYRDRAEADDQVSDPEEDREIEDSFEEAFQGLEWEILLAVNNLNRDLDDETMLGVVEEGMNEWRGNPPAAKSVVEALPVIHLSREELKENEATCAICWSEISAKEPVRQLPCRHYYHGDCIMPWLGIRNTCPVCRFELPTDDLEYEYEKRDMDGGGLSEDLPASYENFHVFL